MKPREQRLLLLFGALAIVGVIIAILLILSDLQNRTERTSESLQGLGALMCHATTTHADRNVNQGAHSGAPTLKLDIEPGGFVEVLPRCAKFGQQLDTDELSLEGSRVILGIEP